MTQNSISSLHFFFTFFQKLHWIIQKSYFFFQLGQWVILFFLWNISPRTFPYCCLAQQNEEMHKIFWFGCWWSTTEREGGIISTTWLNKVLVNAWVRFSLLWTHAIVSIIYSLNVEIYRAYISLCFLSWQIHNWLI